MQVLSFETPLCWHCRGWFPSPVTALQQVGSCHPALRSPQSFPSHPKLHFGGTPNLVPERSAHGTLRQTDRRPALPGPALASLASGLPREHALQHADPPTSIYYQALRLLFKTVNSNSSARSEV